MKELKSRIFEYTHGALGLNKCRFCTRKFYFLCSNNLFQRVDLFVILVIHRPVISVVKYNAIGAGGLGSIPESVKSAQCRQRLAVVAWSYVAQALSRGDGPCDLLHALA